MSITGPERGEPVKVGVASRQRRLAQLRLVDNPLTPEAVPVGETID
jgi:hypothetical protein